MEKIYMQDQQSQQQFQQQGQQQGSQNGKRGRRGQRNRQLDFSVVLSFVVAIFAIFSIATFGIVSNQGSNVSYAAPTGDSFSMIIPNSDQGTASVFGKGYTNGSTPEWFNVPLYYADSISGNNRVFCVEMRKEGGDGVTYNRDEIVTDPGLLYILNNSFANGVRITGYNGPNADEIEVWATQAAIWLYLAEKYPEIDAYKFYNSGDKKYPPGEETVSLDTKAALENATSFMIFGGTDSGAERPVAGVPAKVRTLVNAAKNATSSSATARINVSVANKQTSKTSDGKYYQTSLVTVSGLPANSFTGYQITSLKGIDGAKIVDENGKDIALNTTLAPSKKFYVRVPVSKITEKKQELMVNISGSFNMKTGIYYVSEGKQKVVSFADNPQVVNDGQPFEFIGSPDTGMNTAQTIYFIGLIVLLCGVGIVYANARPVQSKQ